MNVIKDLLDEIYSVEAEYLVKNTKLKEKFKNILAEALKDYHLEIDYIDMEPHEERCYAYIWCRGIKNKKALKLKYKIGYFTIDLGINVSEEIEQEVQKKLDNIFGGLK